MGNKGRFLWERNLRIASSYLMQVKELMKIAAKKAAIKNEDLTSHLHIHRLHKPDKNATANPDDFIEGEFLHNSV